MYIIKFLYKGTFVFAQVCHKCFKQKGSLLYHQKAAHDLNVELSQGLEERYLRLKTRSAMRSLAALDGLNHSGMDGFVPFSHSSQDGLFAGVLHDHRYASRFICCTIVH